MTAAHPRNGATVEVFFVVDGKRRWVEIKGLRPGQTVSAEVTVEVGGKPVKHSVSPGLAVVDITEGALAGKVLLMRTATGQLVERFVEVDKKSPRREELWGKSTRAR